MELLSCRFSPHLSTQHTINAAKFNICVLQHAVEIKVINEKPRVTTSRPAPAQVTRRQRPASTYTRIPIPVNHFRKTPAIRRQNVTTRRERPRSTLGIGQAYDDVVTLAAADVNESVVPRSSSFLSQLELPRHDNSHDVIKQSRDVNRLLHVRRVRQRNVYMCAPEMCNMYKGMKV